MPELPDVEVLKQYVDSTSLHKKVVDVEVKNERILDIRSQVFKEQIRNRRFEDTGRTGKYLFLSLDSGEWVVMHFGMTGGLTFGKKEEADQKHSRILFQFEGDDYLSCNSQRKLGSVTLADHPSDFKKDHNLGVDALEVTSGEFRKLVQSKRGRIKSALMDQKMITGIGNVYSDEILYQCKIHPETKTGHLSDEQIKELHRSMRRIFKTSVNNGADAGNMPKHYLISHREDGAECPDCSGKVQRIKIGGRGCFICPECQQKL